jgi:hypothetical protein
MRKVSVTEYVGEDGKMMRGLLFDGYMFDYGMDEKSIRHAHAYASRGEGERRGVVGDLQRHFLSSLSEFLGRPLGRPVTLAELNKAIETGEME